MIEIWKGPQLCLLRSTAFFVNNVDHAEAGAHPGNTEPNLVHAEPSMQHPFPVQQLARGSFPFIRGAFLSSCI